MMIHRGALDEKRLEYSLNEDACHGFGSGLELPGGI